MHMKLWRRQYGMAKPWDDMMKRIFAARPQDFVKWLLIFRFWNIKLWEMPVNVLRAADLAGILPLCLLAQGGKQYEVAEDHLVSQERE